MIYCMHLLCFGRNFVTFEYEYNSMLMEYQLLQRDASLVCVLHMNAANRLANNLHDNIDSDQVLLFRKRVHVLVFLEHKIFLVCP